MLFLVILIFIWKHFLIVGIEGEGAGGIRSAENGWGFVEVKELASLSVLAEAMIFEIGADPCFVLLVESMLVPELGLSVGKGTLPYSQMYEIVEGAPSSIIPITASLSNK